MVSFGRKLIVAVAYGVIIGAVLAVLFAGVATFISALNPANTLTSAIMAGFGFSIGFGGAVAVTLAEDLNATEAAAK